MKTNSHMPLCEDYVSFETAKLLKEKGFDWLESPFYSEQDRDEWRQNNSYTVPNEEYNPELPFDSETLIIVAPHVSIQMAMKWLRKVHNLHIAVIVAYHHIPRRYEAHIMKLENIDDFILHQQVDFASYEEACEAGIKFCLENLI